MKTYIALVEPGDEATAHGVTFPDLPGVHSAADEEGDILHNAIEALRLWAEDEDMPEPSTKEAILQREDVRAALAEGSYLLEVPLMALETTRFDIQDFITTPEHQIGVLGAAFADGDPDLIATIIADIAESWRRIGLRNVAIAPEEDDCKRAAIELDNSR
jgi:predicted RNase H-like HicB family nuclease